MAGNRWGLGPQSLHLCQQQHLRIDFHPAPSLQEDNPLRYRELPIYLRLVLVDFAFLAELRGRLGHGLFIVLFLWYIGTHHLESLHTAF